MPQRGNGTSSDPSDNGKQPPVLRTFTGTSCGVCLGIPISGSPGPTPGLGARLSTFGALGLSSFRDLFARQMGVLALPTLIFHFALALLGELKAMSNFCLLPAATRNAVPPLFTGLLVTF